MATVYDHGLIIAQWLIDQGVPITLEVCSGIDIEVRAGEPIKVRATHYIQPYVVVDDQAATTTSDHVVPAHSTNAPIALPTPVVRNAAAE